MSTANKLSTKVEKTELNGLPAYLLTDRVGGNGSKIYVSTDGLARLMRVEGAKGEGSLDFTEWDAVMPLSPPPRDQIIRLPGP